MKWESVIVVQASREQGARLRGIDPRFVVRWPLKAAHIALMPQDLDQVDVEISANYATLTSSFSSHKLGYR